MNVSIMIFVTIYSYSKKIIRIFLINIFKEVYRNSFLPLSRQEKELFLALFCAPQLTKIESTGRYQKEL
jgi:hypothetical protein